MEQSIARSQTNVRSDEQTGINWQSVLQSAIPWLRTTATAVRSAARVGGRALASTARRLKGPLSEFPEVNADDICARLNVEERGRTDGRAEQPGSGEQALTGTQREIVAYFAELQRRAQRRHTALTDKLRNLEEAFDIDDTVQSLREIPSRCESDILRLNAEFGSKLELINERENQAQKHYADFREKNDLGRAAEYARSPLSYYAVVAGLIAAAAIVLGRISPAGLGGDAVIPASWAVSLALASVLVPFVLGATVFRSKNHISGSRRLLGWLGGAVALSSIAALAVLTGLVLTARMTDPGASLLGIAGALPVGLDQLLAEVASWSGIATWTALGTVCLAGFTAFLIGYKSDDPYPGYGAVQRAFHRARHERQILAKRLRKRINGIVDTAIAEVSCSPKRLKAQVKQHSRLTDRLRRMPERLSAHDLALEDVCNIVLDRYRAANASARRTDVPLSFSEQIRLRSRQGAAAVPEGDEPGVTDLQRSLSALEGEVAKALQRLRDLNSAEIRALEETTWALQSDPSPAPVS